MKKILYFPERLKPLPAYVATQEGGEGFAEIVQTILSLRTAKEPNRPLA